MKRFSIPPREERERHSHTMSAYWRIGLCKVYTVWQILYLQPICRRYLQRSNYLSTSALHAFRCR
ncbi:hypothetical protein F2Y43_23140 [Phocaeicola dorei]|nr:hypothetical protein F2Y43_23140 [Phocaeicola dorei]